MNELCFDLVVWPIESVALNLRLCHVQVNLELLELLDLCSYVFDLCVNVGNKAVMRDSSLCRRKHGLFLGEENILLVLCEIASEKGLGKSEMLNL
jgi:hypothetical protein